MLLAEFLFALVLALVLATLLTYVVWPDSAERADAWPMGFFFFFLLLFTIWAGGIWVTPVGPELWGVRWVPFVTIGIIIALLLAAGEPSHRRLRSPRSGAEAELEPDTTTTTATELRGQEAAAVAWSMFFWLVLFVLVTAIIARYAWPWA